MPTEADGFVSPPRLLGQRATAAASLATIRTGVRPPPGRSRGRGAEAARRPGWQWQRHRQPDDGSRRHQSAAPRATWRRAAPAGTGHCDKYFALARSHSSCQPSTLCHRALYWPTGCRFVCQGLSAADRRRGRCCRLGRGRAYVYRDHRRSPGAAKPNGFLGRTEPLTTRHTRDFRVFTGAALWPLKPGDGQGPGWRSDRAGLRLARLAAPPGGRLPPHSGAAPGPPRRRDSARTLTRDAHEARTAIARPAAWLLAAGLSSKSPPGQARAAPPTSRPKPPRDWASNSMNSSEFPTLLASASQ